MQEVKTPKRSPWLYWLIGFFVLLILNQFVFTRMLTQKVESVDYGTFLNMLSDKKVEKVQIEGESIYFYR